jgi:small subunit ribosomal protein S9
MQIINTIGRRKTSIARVYVTPGKGDIIVNDRDLKDYFISEIHQTLVKQALAALKLESSYDVTVNVEGGGVTGQAEAVRLGIARALVEISPENKPTLRKEGFMTRDSRMVERKKPGRRKARRKFQFSKR